MVSRAAIITRRRQSEFRPKKAQVVLNEVYGGGKIMRKRLGSVGVTHTMNDVWQPGEKNNLNGTKRGIGASQIRGRGQKEEVEVEVVAMHKGSACIVCQLHNSYIRHRITPSRMLLCSFQNFFPLHFLPRPQQNFDKASVPSIAAVMCAT